MDTTPRYEVTALGRLAARCYDRRRLVLVLWIVAIIGVTVISIGVGTTFKNKFTAGNTPSQQAQNILQERFPSKSGDTADIVFHTSTPIAARSSTAASASRCRSSIAISIRSCNLPPA